MNKKYLLIAIFVLSVLLLVPHSARADGIIIPEPPICIDPPCPPPPPCPGPFPCPRPRPSAPLVIRYHHVTVTIQDQLAVTHVDQTFYNPNEYPVEGTYMFPIPAEAAVTAFTLWVDDQPVEAQMLDAKQARQKYYEIVQSLRDPALLEYSDRGAMTAHIFPIPPKGERRIELEYTQALKAENGLVRYVYPLNTEKFSAWPLENVSVTVDLRASVPIRAVYSPTFELAVSRESDYHVTAGYEASNVTPDRDFGVYYSLGEGQAFHLLTYRDPTDPGDPDGFFLALLAPQVEAGSEILPKDVILVLDHSGSMEGEKFQQALEASRYILQHLNPEDRFGILAFSTAVESYASGLRPTSESDQALTWINRLRAEGSTDIHRALLEAAAIADRERPTYLIFLTDGLPTTGVTDSRKILEDVASRAPEGLRLFAFGVGYDVDTFLLDSLAQAHHGATTYVLPGDPLDEILSAFYARISTPLLTNLELDFGQAGAYDLYPQPLPDLFAGEQILVVGRYRHDGYSDVSLSGETNGERQTFRFPQQNFAAQSGSDTNLAAIPRLWATRKIGYLLRQIRLQGADEETIDQIVRLSIRFGIVTPYTSYLVTEETPLGEAEQERIARDQLSQLQAMPPEPAYGQEAVQKAAGQRALSAAEAPATLLPEGEEKVRIIGAHTYLFREGVWVDTAFDPQKMTTIRIPFLSEEYFALAQANPDLAAAFSLGERVISLSGGRAYEVVDAGEKQQETPPPSTPAPALPTRQPARPTPTNTATPAPGSVPCLGGLLPLILAGFAGVLLRRL